VEPFTRTALAALPRIGGIVRRGVGYDNVDTAAATDAGIVVANVPDASVDEVAEHALACLLALERRVGLIDHSVRAGMWRSDPGALQTLRGRPRRMSELTLGIVGFGRIGRALAFKAERIYGRTQVHDVAVPAGPEARWVTFTTLADLLATSDHISLHLPMSPENRELIGAREIAAMRPGTVLVNTARGGLVDENALAAFVTSGHLLAALDVTHQEPFDPGAAIAADGLRDLLLLTGHAAAWSQTAAAILADKSVEAAARLICGERPSSVVNPDVLTSPVLRIAAHRRKSRKEATSDHDRDNAC
jgi:D-3-phosphoglycerate dehydrogenase